MSIKRFVASFLRILRYAHFLAGATFWLAFVLLILNSVALTVYQVDGHSMEPTFQNEQILPVDLIAFRFQPLVQGEVVIVQYPGNHSIHFVKRIEGVPGDVMPFNGGTITLAADQYFVVGDHRDASTDSRVYGPVPKEDIIGRVIGAPSFANYP